MTPHSSTLFMSAARQAAAERRFRKALGLLRTAWAMEGQENMATWIDMLEAHQHAQQACLEGLIAERLGQKEVAIAYYERAQMLEPVARRRLWKLGLGRRSDEAPIGPAKPASPQDSLAILAELTAIESLAKADSLAAAVDQAQALLKWAAPLPTLKANLERHLLPRLSRRRWQVLPPEALATVIGTEFLNAPEPSTLHNWATACFQLAAHQPGAIPLAVSVGMMAIANLETDPQLKGPGSPDTPTTLATLRSELILWVEGWAKSTPDALDRLRLDRLALQWRGVWRRGPRLAGLVVTPSVTLDPLVSARCGLQDQIKASTSLLAALYTRWGLAMAAAEAEDFTRSAYLEPSEARSPAEQTGARFCRFMQGLRTLRAGDLEHAKAMLEFPPCDGALHEDLMARLEKNFQEGFNQIRGCSESGHIRSIGGVLPFRPRWSGMAAWDEYTVLRSGNRQWPGWMRG